MILPKLQEEINAAYDLLERKQTELVRALLSEGFSTVSGWYNGHYHKTGNGGWCREAYPIPVVTVKGVCDIEISFDGISVSAKRKREAALADSYISLSGYAFEAFGVEDYLRDFYQRGMTVADLKSNIAQSSEEEIGFAFPFSMDVEKEEILALVKLLHRDGFYN